MGTTAQKFAYLSDTKAAIKQAIVSKGIAVPDGTTFREYAKKISSIQDVSSLPTQGAKTVTPTTTEQIAVASGLYTTGYIKVAGDANLVPENIATGVSIFGVTGTHSGGGGGGGILTVTNNSSFKIYGVTESENGPCPCDIDKFDSGRVKANSVVIYLNNVSAARITGDYQDAGYVEFIGNYYPAFLILGDVIFNPGIN